MSGSIAQELVPDNDEPGRTHAAQVARSCHAAGLQVRVVTMPAPQEPAIAPKVEAHVPSVSLSKGFGVPESVKLKMLDVADAGHWQPDVDAEIRRLGKTAMRHRFKDAATLDDPGARSRAAKWAIEPESRARLDALLYLSQAEPPIKDAGDGWDSDPMLLCVPNGVIDLRAGELRPGRREDRITMSAAVLFDPRATCPRRERFLAEVFAGDEDVITFVHRAIGYSLTGDTSAQCLFLCHGDGSNGKGTFTKRLMCVLGDYATNMPFSTLEMRRTSIPNDVAALVGRRFVMASEANDGTRLNEACVKPLRAAIRSRRGFFIRSSSRSSPLQSSGCRSITCPSSATTPTGSGAEFD